MINTPRFTDLLMRTDDTGRSVSPHAFFKRLMSNLCWQWTRKNRTIFAVDICSAGGFGANLEWCLEIMMHCERFQMTPYIRLTGKNYTSEHYGDDYFTYFFENPQLSKVDERRIRNGDVPTTRICHIDDLGLPHNYDVLLTLDDAPKLIKKYLRVKDEITDEVRAFRKAHFGQNVLGIHYRGTDKAEAPRTDYAKVKRNIQHYLEKSPTTDCVFVSSDEVDLIEYIRSFTGNQFPTVRVICRKDKYRSSYKGVKIHDSVPGNNYDKGRDAIVNILLLSTCDVLIKTASIFSGWSRLFNPELPVIMLSAPYEHSRWFPEREILKQVLYEAVD